MAKISVIIPVYNTATYLECAVRSIMSQSLTDIEIIIINDGSTDNSLEVANTMANQDHRIVVYSQQNGGLSVARNNGLQKAVSEFIYFMDSDDELEPDALEHCYKKIVDGNLDIVFFNASILHEDKTTAPFSFDYDRVPIDDSKIYKGAEMMEFLIDHDCYRSSACLYVARRSFIDNIGLSFYPGIIHEDELYTALLFCQAERVGYINQPFFHRRVRSGSIMSIKFGMRNMQGYLTVAQKLTEFSGYLEPKKKRVITKLIQYIINPAIYNASRMKLQDRYIVFKEIIQRDFIKHIKSKNILILILPQLVKLKAIIRNIRNSLSGK